MTVKISASATVGKHKIVVTAKGGGLTATATMVVNVLN